MSEHLDGLWSAICAQVYPHVSADAFQRWFEPTRLLAASEKDLTISVPNAIHQYWIESNYSTHLQDAVVILLGAPRKFLFSPEHAIAQPPMARAAVRRMAPASSGGNSTAGAANFPPKSGTRPLAGPNGRHDAANGSSDHENGSEMADPRPGTVPLMADPATARLTLDQFGAQPTPEGLNPRFVFDAFVVGTGNQFAHAAASAVAEKPARIYNPLFIHGGTGLGKTHLLQAIGLHILAHRKKAKVVYVTSEHFTNEFIDAIQAGTLVKFRKKYRQADVLLIDDIQFFGGKEKSQDEFFHTFNSLFDGCKQIVMASDKPPSDLPRLEARLVSRFEWGLTAQLQPPDVETRLAILSKKAATLDVKVPEAVINFIAERITNNVRRLEGALLRVASFASLSGTALTLPKVEELLRDLLQDDAQPTVSIDRIQRVVAEHFDVRMADMTSKRRPASIAFPRQIAMHLAREMTRHSFAEIGAAFGGRDHGTIMHACKTVIKRMADDSQLRSILLLLQSRIG